MNGQDFYPASPATDPMVSLAESFDAMLRDAQPYFDKAMVASLALIGAVVVVTLCVLLFRRKPATKE